MLDKAKKILKEGTKRIQNLDSEENLISLKQKLLGRKGDITNMLKEIKNIPAEKRGEFGQELNKIKVSLAKEFDHKLNEIKEAELNKKLQEEKIDVTLPGRIERKGSVHPLSQAQKKIEDIFISMGFAVLDGP